MTHLDASILHHVVPYLDWILLTLTLKISREVPFTSLRFYFRISRHGRKKKRLLTDILVLLWKKWIHFREKRGLNVKLLKNEWKKSESFLHISHAIWTSSAAWFYYTGCPTSIFAKVKASGSLGLHFRPQLSKAKICFILVHFIC